MLSFALIAMSLMTQTAVGKMAVVRTFATKEEIGHLTKSITDWDATMPCAEAPTSQVDLILVYSKDIGTDPQAKATVEAYEASFAQGQNWTRCFAGIKNMSAGLVPEEDQYDEHGYAMNRHWVTGPNMVFIRSMEAFYTGAFVGEYSNIFWMEVDAVPVMSGWLNKFEEEAAEMPERNMAIRGSLYFGSNWQPFSYMMPTYILNHVNGNAIYNLEHEWSKFLFDLIKAPENSQVMEEMAFDTAYSAITVAAMTGSNTMLAEAWAARNGSATTYSSETQLVRNYANTLLNKSHDVGAYIRHGSISNLFDSIPGEEVTLGVAALSEQNDHFMSSIGTNHPFKKILMLTYDSSTAETLTIPAPGGDVTLSIEASEQGPMMHLCEVAAKVSTPWFAVATNYHIINAPVSLLMDMDQPVLPYLLASSSYCMDRPDCKAALDQAEELFGIKLNYHHDVTEVLFNTTETESFCAAWTVATRNKSLEDCQLVSGPSADDFMAWKLSIDMSITGTPRERTRYGWRSWTTLWEPLPVDTRNCSVYGFEEYADNLAYISNCSLNVENASACNANGACKWEPMFETGVCLPDRPGLSTAVNIAVPTTTTTAVTTNETSEIPPGPEEMSASGLAVASLMIVTASAIQVFG